MRARLVIAASSLMALGLAACSGSEMLEDGAAVPAQDEADADTGDAEESESDTGASTGSGDAVELVIESWRVEDTAVWEDVIIPAFEAEHEGISVRFSPTVTPEYPGVLRTRLEGGNAGDLITCRPFDNALELYDAGHLAAIDDLAGLENFSDVATSAWQTLDGSTTFCLPVASVLHGFVYNADIFEELGLSEPETFEEFEQLLTAIDEDGQYAPIAMGAASEDGWYPETLLFQTLGPNNWDGENGRQALIAGDARFTDAPYVDTFQTMVDWTEFLPNGFQGIGYTDAQNLFVLGQAAIFPAGSWEINFVESNVDFPVGAFRPPAPSAADSCWINDHVDMGMGINAATPHPEEARIFLEWMAGAEFAQLFSNSLPGFFSLGSHEVSLDNELAQEYVSWRDECGATIRNTYQILNSGSPAIIDEMWRVVPLLLTGELTPEAAAEEIQSGLSSWYEPHQD